MKYSYLLFLLLCCFTIQAQSNADQSYTIDLKQEQHQKLVDARYCFFKTQEDVSRLWKFNVIDLLNTSYNFSDPIRQVENGIGLSFEQKISTGWSVNTSLAGGLIKTDSDDSNTEFSNFLDLDDTSYRYELSIEPRWYFQKNRQIKKGYSGDNLSGGYLSLLIGVDKERSTYKYQYIDFIEAPYPNPFILPAQNKITSVKSDYVNSSNLFLINFGWQYQFSKNGFFNMKWSGGAKKNVIKNLYYEIDGEIYPRDNIVDWTPSFRYDVEIGFAIDNHVAKKIPKDCTIFEYHIPQNRLFKMTLSNPFRFFTREYFVGETTIGVEQKIRQSPFSLNLSMVSAVSILLEDRTTNTRVDWEVEPRYYYDLKKRMAQGKTGNSFSANYIGLRSKFRFDNRKSFGIAPVLGLQRQFFKHILFDYKLGPEWRVEHNSKDKDILFFSELKIGVAF